MPAFTLSFVEVVEGEGGGSVERGGWMECTTVIVVTAVVGCLLGWRQWL